MLSHVQYVTKVADTQPDYAYTSIGTSASLVSHALVIHLFYLYTDIKL